jgi:predicted lipoprotein with Yx(FWY)xxD motif
MNLSKSRSVTYAFAAAALATIAAGCGSSSSGGGGNQALQPAGGGSTSSAHTAGLTTRSTSLGTVVADSKGNTVYELVGNPASNSKCSAACMAIWPPVMSGSKIAVVHGHPVFTFTGDSAPGQTNGQNVTDSFGQWFALDAQGQPVPASGGGSAPAPSSAPSSSGGGYGY